IEELLIPLFLSSRIRPPPSSTLFPYTTLFRSEVFDARILLQRDEALGRRHGVRGDVERTRADDLVAREGVEQRKHLAVLRFLSRSEEHTSELQSRSDLVCRLLLEKKKDQPQRL